MISMKCAALTGISPEVIKQLKMGKPRTLELLSAHNVVTIAGIEAGTSLFLTSVDMEDLSAGDSGIIVDIISTTISMKRIIEFSQGLHFEERERTSARIQVKCNSSATVRSISHEGVLAPTLVEVVKTSCYHAV